MRAAFRLTFAVLLPAALSGQDTRAEYEKLISGFAEETAQYRDADARVAPLLPDVSPFHAKFLDAAQRYEGTEAALPYLGWVLQNAPRNRQAHGAAVAAIYAMAELKATDLRDAGKTIEELYDASDRAVGRLKYSKVDDVLFAQTLLDARAVARATDDAQIRDASSRSLYKLENLQVGMVAPDIVGNDLDGVQFKLSDYRGKVVILDFWGDW